MRFDRFLAPADARRASQVIEKLVLLGLRDFALTGGLAIEAHLAGHSTMVRSLNDVDIVVESFAAIPPALADGFLFRHIHPHAPRGRTLVQLVDPSEAVRIDIFGACGATLARSAPVNFPCAPIAVVALEDLAAREASLLMDLAHGSPVPLKHARDFQRLAGAVATADSRRMAQAWGDHRKSRDPETFDEAAARIAELAQSRRDLLTVPDYSRDADAVCSKCRETGTFRLAPAGTILSILGYC
ncbi:MAG TPA: hypothetical protein VN924_30075 [Bryobacteraceae bacterium]|nr:hypothetical protein [Bryobacteraceae bacterium]